MGARGSPKMGPPFPTMFNHDFGWRSRIRLLLYVPLLSPMPRGSSGDRQLAKICDSLRGRWRTVLRCGEEREAPRGASIPRRISPAGADLAYAGFGARYAPDRCPAPVTEALYWAHARSKFFELADIAASARRGS